MNQRVRIHKGTANTGAMDFSWLLDAPAGKHGFVRAKEGHFYFEDGTRAKFVGFNFPARANMPDHETADRVSAKLASLGVNVVRLHAVDARLGGKGPGWSSNPDSPVIDYAAGNSRGFHPVGQERFDYWVAKLKEKGIYVHVDLLVGRSFLDGDDLDYPDGLSSTKSNSHVNARLIELQKEYATGFLTHVNPYTGLALIDEPAVMGIQISNEDSFFFEAKGRWNAPGREYYEKEAVRKFNRFLLSKYDTRANLAKAWTFEGQCALREDEDPAEGTVRMPKIGDYHQPMCDPMGDWMGEEDPEWNGHNCPARYADFCEFGMLINRRYYGEMIDHVRSLGSKVPIATSCLLVGAADIYSHADGDFMENNTYFNHPAPRITKAMMEAFMRGEKPKRGDKRPIFVPYMREYVVSDPRTTTDPGFDIRSNLTTQASGALIDGKPFVLSEWNEYGENPFHASAFIMTAAYGCLNDWDGLIVYCYHTNDELDVYQKDDEIADIMDAYNDPSLILQFGLMSAILLKGLVREAENKIDIVFTRKDLLTQPKDHRMPFTFFPFVSKVRNVYLEHGAKYQGGADVAVSGGFVSGGDYTDAKHAVVYARSPYREAYRRNYAGDAHFDAYREENGTEIPGVAEYGEKYLVFPDVDKANPGRNYTAFAAACDEAMKAWGVIGPDRGCVGSAMISDTGELMFDPAGARFAIRNEECPFFTGKPEGEIALGSRFAVEAENDRITLSVLPLDGEKANRSRHLLFTAIGRTGMDGTTYEMDEDGFTTRVTLGGKLYLEVLEGALGIAGGENAAVYALDTYGNRIGEVKKDGERFLFDGSYPSGSFEIVMG